MFRIGQSTHWQYLFLIWTYNINKIRYVSCMDIKHTIPSEYYLDISYTVLFVSYLDITITSCLFSLRKPTGKTEHEWRTCIILYPYDITFSFYKRVCFELLFVCLLIFLSLYVNFCFILCIGSVYSVLQADCQSVFSVNN